MLRVFIGKMACSLEHIPRCTECIEVHKPNDPYPVLRDGVYRNTRCDMTDKKFHD